MPSVCCLAVLLPCCPRCVLPRCTAGFLLYSLVALGLIIYLIFWVAPLHGTENVLVYLAICSLAGSFTVTSCKVGAAGQAEPSSAMLFCSSVGVCLEA